MRDGLGIGRDEVVLFVRQVDVSRLERLEDPLDYPDLFIRCPVLNDDLCTINSRSIASWLLEGLLEAALPS